MLSEFVIETVGKVSLYPWASTKALGNSISAIWVYMVHFYSALCLANEGSYKRAFL